MNRYLLLLASTILFASTGCIDVEFNNSERDEVLTVLRNYRDAVTAKDGNAAIQFVSQDSIDRIAEFQQWALHDSADELKQRSIYEQIQVLSIRHQLKDKDLHSITPENVLVEIINSGSYSTNLLKNARFGDTIFYHDRKLCYIALYDQGLPTKNRVTCKLDPDGWRVHLPGSEGVESNVYAKIMEDKEISETDLIKKIVKSWAGEEFSEQLWEPIVKF